MKAKSLIIITVVGLGGLAVVYWLLNKGTTSTTVMPAGSPTSHGKEEGILTGIAAVIAAAAHGGAEVVNSFKSKDDQKVDDGDKSSSSSNPYQLDLGKFF